MTAAFDLDVWLAARRTEIEILLDTRLPARPPADDPGRLVEAMRYSLLAPGKRLRPLLALAAAEAVGAPGTDPIRVAALTVELVHCYSLIHDDLPAMDDDDFRRGRPSCHKAFGEATAILAGDALLTLAFEWLADAGLSALRTDSGTAAGMFEAARALAAGAGVRGMVRGQARDLGESPPSDLDALERLHAEKTGALFRAAIEIGAAAAGASPQATADLRRFADAFGLAFQHVDDLEDRDHSQHASGPRLLQLLAAATHALDAFGPAAAPLQGFCAQLATRAAHA